MAALFTVPTTGRYASADGKDVRQFTAGDILDMREAVRFQMAGAAVDAASTALNTGQTTEATAIAATAQAAAIAAAVAADAVIQAAGVNAKLLSEARTATAAPGGTTGVITAGVDVVAVTSDDANKVITLPALAVGAKVSLRNGATGYELRSSAPATIGINGGVAANAESAIAASTHVWCEGDTATNIICWQRIADGTLAVTEVASP